jgi:hypothetical protein
MYISATHCTEAIIKWQGGQLYEHVKVEARQVSSGLSGQVNLNNTLFDWEQEAVGLPTILNNTGLCHMYATRHLAKGLARAVYTHRR